MKNKIRIGRESACWRPYVLNYQGKKYKVEKIIFYKNNEKLFTTGSWLEKMTIESAQRYCGGKDIEEIFIKQPIRKLKENLTLKENYFISKNDYIDGKICTLYIYIDDSITIKQTEQASKIETSLDITEYKTTYTEFEIKGITLEPFTTVKIESSKGAYNELGQKATNLVEKHKNDFRLSFFSIYDWAEILKHYELKEIKDI